MARSSCSCCSQQCYRNSTPHWPWLVTRLKYTDLYTCLITLFYISPRIFLNRVLFSQLFYSGSCCVRHFREGATTNRGRLTAQRRFRAHKLHLHVTRLLSARPRVDTDDRNIDGRNKPNLYGYNVNLLPWDHKIDIFIIAQIHVFFRLRHYSSLS